MHMTRMGDEKSFRLRLIKISPPPTQKEKKVGVWDEEKKIPEREGCKRKVTEALGA